MCYIFNESGCSRACIHIATHKDRGAKSYCRETIEVVSDILSSEVLRAPSTTTSATTLATGKEFLSRELFALDREKIPGPLCGDSLVTLMEKFRLLS